MTTRARSSLRQDLGRALAVGAVGGVLLGMREGLMTLAANAFADAEHHSLAYLIVPIGLWFVMAPLLLAPLALLSRAFGGASAATYAGLLGSIGTILALLPSLESALSQMRATGNDPTSAVHLLLATFTMIVALTVGALVRAATTVYARRSSVGIRGAVSAATIVGGLSLLWTTRFLLVSLAPGAAHASIAPAVPSSAPAGAANVLVVSIDTLRADELGAYGGRPGITPALDRLAAGGVTFEQAISTAPWTLPALASIMTGLYPRHHGAGLIVNPRDPLGRSPLASDVETLAQSFALHGYRTKAVVTNPYLLARSGLGDGFQSYLNVTLLSEAMLSGRGNAAQWLIDHIASNLVVGDRGVEVSDRAVQWIQHVDESRPFFLWLHYLDPHGPYSGAANTRHKSFRAETTFGARASDAIDLAVRSPDPVRMRSGELRLDDTQKAAVRALYRAEVSEVDRQVGRVLDALEARGLADRTIVVLVSDHGEEFWDHGGVEHGHTLYEELLRAVLLIRWPGRLPAGERVGTAVSMVDVAPTLRDLAGLGPAAQADGVSLRGAMLGEAPSGRALLSENLLFAEERVSIRTDTAKLIRWENGKEEAYDLLDDPLERRDLAGVEGFVAPLRAELDALEQGMDPVSPSGAVGVTPTAALRALGYVQ